MSQGRGLWCHALSRAHRMPQVRMDGLHLTREQHLWKGWKSSCCLGLWIWPKLSNFFCLGVTALKQRISSLSCSSTQDLTVGQHCWWGWWPRPSQAGATQRQASFMPKKNGVRYCAGRLGRPILLPGLGRTG